MKYFLTISIFLLLCPDLWAQDLMVENLNEELTTTLQKASTDNFTITNYSNEVKSIKVSIDFKGLQGGSTAEICHKGECYQQNQFFIINIPANGSSDNISIVLNGGLSNFKGYAHLQLTDLNYDNSIEKNISLEVTNQRNSDIFFRNNDVSVGSFFPNPAVKYADMDYRIPFDYWNEQFYFQRKD